MAEWFFMLAAGFFVSAYDAMVGSGGLLLSAILSFFGMPIFSTVGTIRLLSVIQSGVSAMAYKRKNMFQLSTALFYGGIAAIGGLIGGMLFIAVPAHALSVVTGGVFLVLLLVVPRIQHHTEQQLSNPLACFRWFVWKLFHRGPKELPLQPDRKTALLVGVCFLIGIYGGFFGSGYETLMFFSIALLGGLGFLRSIGYTKAIVFCLSLTSFIAVGHVGIVDWSLFVPLAAGSILGSIAGVEWANVMPIAWLRRLLVIVMILASVKLLFFS